MIETIPDEVAAAVRRAADAVPPGTHDFRTVRRRHRAYRTRRTVTTAGLAAVVVGAVAVAVPVALRGALFAEPTDPPVAGQPAVVQTEAQGDRSQTARPAQRLLLLRASDRRMQVGNEVVTIDVPDGLLEVGADGGVVAHRRNTVMDRADSTVPLRDGRFVQLGPKDLRPGVPRDDGPWVADVAFVLAVVAPDGSATLTRDVRIMGEDVQLVGATETEAYLLRRQNQSGSQTGSQVGSQIVSHNLATGAEQPLADATAAFDTFTRDTGTRNNDVAHARASVQGNRLVMWVERSNPGGTQGRLRIVDLRSGAPVADVTLDASSAHGVHDVRLSPDGSRAAVHGIRMIEDPSAADWRQRHRTEHRALVVDMATGGVRADRLVVEEAAVQIADLAGIAWADSSTLRVASYAVPAGATGDHRLADVLRVDTLRV